MPNWFLDFGLSPNEAAERSEAHSRINCSFLWLECWIIHMRNFSCKPRYKVFLVKLGTLCHMLGARNENSQRIYIALWLQLWSSIHIHILACTKRPGWPIHAPHSGINGLRRLLLHDGGVERSHFFRAWHRRRQHPRADQQGVKILCQPSYLAGAEATTIAACQKKVKLAIKWSALLTNRTRGNSCFISQSRDPKFQPAARFSR